MLRRNCLLTVALLSSPSSSRARLGGRLLEGDNFELDFEAAHADASVECNGDSACIMKQMTEFVEALDEITTPSPTSGPTDPSGLGLGDVDPITILEDPGGVPDLGPSDASAPPPGLDFPENPGPPPSDVDVTEIPDFDPEDPIVPGPPPQDAGDGGLPDIGGDLPEVPDLGLPETPEAPGFPELPDADLPDIGGDLPGVPDPQDAGDGGLPDIGGDLPEVPDLGLPEDPLDAGDGDLPDFGGGLPDFGGGLPDMGDFPDIGGDMGDVEDGALGDPGLSDAGSLPLDGALGDPGLSDAGSLPLDGALGDPGLSDAGSLPLDGALGDPGLSDAGSIPLPDVPDLPANEDSINPEQVADAAGSQGDPHFKTWRNEHFEYHGQCDLVLVQDPNFADGLGLDVQIRTKLVRYWSYIKSVAIRIGTDIFEIEGSPDQEESSVRYWINLEFQGPANIIGGFPIVFNSGEGKAMKKQTVVIDLSSKYPGTQVEFQVWKEFVKVNFVNPSCDAFGNTVGMLGNYHTGKTVGRDGVTVLDDFMLLGEEWQVLPSEEMLFHSSEEPQFPAKCIEPEEIQGLRRRRRLEEVTVTEEQAEQACASLSDEIDRKDCIYDILATQNLDMVGAY